MSTKGILWSALLLLCSIQTLFAQQDSLILINGDVIVGEVKAMERGVATVGTDYSDSDFKIEWEGIKEIYTETSFLITLTDGRRFNGRLRSTPLDRVNLFPNGSDQPITLDYYEVVYLQSVDETFASRLSANIDLGISITRAQNLRQFNLAANIGYLAERWSLDGYYSLVTSSQDSISSIRRGDGGISFRYFLPKDWYLATSFNFYSSTEQRLNLRTTLKLGVGNLIIHTNQTYWGVGAGINLNQEDFSSDDADRQSMEGYFGSELNIYDLGDFSILSNLTAFPSFTESGRWRVDFNLDTKYDLPLDFYIRLGFNLNFDNQPVAGAGRTDYTFQTGLGWEW
jgi:hypothetical protein